MNWIYAVKRGIELRHLIVTIVLLSTLEGSGQDLHFSQFYHNPLQMSPAATGASEGDIRAAFLYRNQWQGVPVAYNTFAGAVDWKAIKQENNLLSIGLLLQRDHAGDAGLSWLQLGSTLAVAHRLNSRHFVSLGFGVYLVQRSFESNKLTFKNQWNGLAFDPDLASGEPLNPASGLKPSLSSGVYWHFEDDLSRSNFKLGAGLGNLNRPLVSLGDFDERLGYRISFFSNANLQINTSSDLVFVAKFDHLRKSRELLFGAGIRFILSTGIANEMNFQATLSNRFGDALIPAVQLERNNWTFGVSYDWNISPFSKATNGQGGMEIAVVWKKIPVKALNNVKSCPVF